MRRSFRTFILAALAVFLCTMAWATGPVIQRTPIPGPELVAGEKGCVELVVCQFEYKMVTYQDLHTPSGALATSKADPPFVVISSNSADTPAATRNDEVGWRRGVQLLL